MRITERRRENSGMPFRSEYVALYLAEGNWPRSEFSIRVDNRIRRVLPALVNQPGATIPLILDEAVVVWIAVGVDPAQCCEDIWP